MTGGVAAWRSGLVTGLSGCRVVGGRLVRLMQIASVFRQGYPPFGLAPAVRLHRAAVPLGCLDPEPGAGTLDSALGDRVDLAGLFLDILRPARPVAERLLEVVLSPGLPVPIGSVVSEPGQRVERCGPAG